MKQQPRQETTARIFESYVRLTICYLVEYSEDWGSERSYIREDKALGSLDRLHELMAQAAN